MKVCHLKERLWKINDKRFRKSFHISQMVSNVAQKQTRHKVQISSKLIINEIRPSVFSVKRDAY